MNIGSSRSLPFGMYPSRFLTRTHATNSLVNMSRLAGVCSHWERLSFPPVALFNLAR